MKLYRVVNFTCAAAGGAPSVAAMATATVIARGALIKVYPYGSTPVLMREYVSYWLGVLYCGVYEATADNHSSVRHWLVSATVESIQLRFPSSEASHLGVTGQLEVLILNIVPVAGKSGSIEPVMPKMVPSWSTMSGSKGTWPLVN